MRPALRAIALGALAVAVIGGAVAWWLHAYERVDETVPMPRRGEAATHRLFALRVALEADGRRARTWRRLDPQAIQPGPRDSLVFDGDPRGLDADDVAALLRWVRAGGHLVVATPAPDAAVDTMLRSRRAQARSLPVPLLDAIGVRTRLEAPACVPLRLSGEGPHREFCNGRRFDAPAHAQLRWRDARGDAFARIAVGAGRVDVLAELDFLTTDKLAECTHVAMARQLVAPMDRGGTVHLVHVRDMPSLWGWLLREGWRVWVPLALLLAGWLWARMRRFGPLRPAPVLDRRSLMEHIAASGEHQWRYGDSAPLYEAMREAFFARLRRRDPLAAALAGEAQLERLVERLGLSRGQLVDALTPPDPRDAKALHARIVLLVRMRNRL